MFTAYYPCYVTSIKVASWETHFSISSDYIISCVYSSDNLLITMATPYSSPLHSPHRRRDVTPARRNDPCVRASAVSPCMDLPLWRIEDLCDPEICDSCSCDITGDTRFLTSMVTHQLPVPDTSEENEDLLLASLVAHMVCKLIGDEDR